MKNFEGVSDNYNLYSLNTEVQGTDIHPELKINSSNTEKNHTIATQKYCNKNSSDSIKPDHCVGSKSTALQNHLLSPLP